MKTVLFLCSGNTCRSPMAQALFTAACKRLGRDDLRAVSAGVSTMDGRFASEGAMRAMARRGLDLRAHRSRQLTARELMDVSLVVGMSERHIDWVRRFYPNASVPLYAFDPPIGDPVGGGDAEYELAATALEKQIERLLNDPTVLAKDEGGTR